MSVPLAKLLRGNTSGRYKYIKHKRIAERNSASGGPVKVSYLSVDLVYRSAFPLVRVDIYPN